MNKKVESKYGVYLLDLLRKPWMLDARIAILGAQNLAKMVYQEILAPLGW